MLDEEQLFDIETPPPSTLAGIFGEPPLSVLDRRSGRWLGRKRQWLSLGIQSEIGREQGMMYGPDRTDPMGEKLNGLLGGVSMFDPVICELAYRWHTLPGDRVLDPFAGGSVRGIVASTLGRDYTGVDIRPEQIAANREQAHLGSSIAPRWIEGDATRLPDCLDGDGFDLVFTCPPYGDLEVYSDLDRDISTWPYDEFLDGQDAAIRDSLAALSDDRYAVWVASDIRDRGGYYRGLVHDTVSSFERHGARLLNEAIVLDPIATTAMRAERPFRATRKLSRVHQVLLVFVKGDLKRAAQRVEGAS